MKVHVDHDVCDLHGQCVFTAPEIFRFDDRGELEHLDEVGADLATAAKRAAGVCPTGAIEVAE